MKKLVTLFVAISIAMASFAQVDSGNVKIPLKFRRQHIMLFGFYLQSFNEISRFDLYSRMQRALVTSDTVNQNQIVNINISSNEYTLFNQFMNTDQTGQLYLIYDELVRGGNGFTGLLAQLGSLMTIGTPTQRAGARKMFNEADKQTKAMLAARNEKIYQGSKFLFITPIQ